MKRRQSLRRLVGGLALLLAAVIVAAALVPNLRGDPPGASPATLRRIAMKNDRAAAESAAAQRDKSRTTAEAADALRDTNEAAATPVVEQP